MSKYRFKIEVEFIVEIDQENTSISAPSALQGDSPLVAVRRALWFLCRQDIKSTPGLLEQVILKSRPLGIKHILVRTKDSDVLVKTEESLGDP